MEKARLIKLLKEAEAAYHHDMNVGMTEFVAEYLIKNNITYVPCKVGDAVYETDGTHIYSSEIKKIIYDTSAGAFDETAIGQSIFLTKEEAENKNKLRQQAITETERAFILGCFYNIKNTGKFPNTGHPVIKCSKCSFRHIACFPCHSTTGCYAGWSFEKNGVNLEVNNAKTTEY